MDLFLTVAEVDASLGERMAVRAGQRAGFSAVCTDSRAVAAGNLFVALKGDNFDGHAYVAAAKSAGAAGAVVSRAWAAAADRAGLTSGGFVLWMVDDTLLALGDVARGHLRRLPVQRGALTGSNGKTTTKEFTAAILRRHFGDEKVLVTHGNLNNQVGLPLTALRAQPSHVVALFELGMNHAGEIAALCHVAEPEVGLITNVGPAHIGNFAGRIEGVADAKGELFRHLAPGGRMVVNLDDERVLGQARAVRGREMATFGRSAAADVRLVREAQAGDEMQVTLSVRGTEVQAAVPALGSHNALNACAAAALALELGAAIDDVAAGLATARLVSGRLTRRKATSGALVLDDSYNANPASVRAAIEVARREADLGPRRLVLVLGDMLELGDLEAALHAEVGKAVAAAKPDLVVAAGARSKATVDGAVASGLEAARVRHAAALEELLPGLVADVRADDVVLVKGSRGARMERAVAALCGSAPAAGH